MICVCGGEGVTQWKVKGFHQQLLNDLCRGKDFLDFYVVGEQTTKKKIDELGCTKTRIFYMSWKGIAKIEYPLEKYICNKSDRKFLNILNKQRYLK